MVDVHNFKMKKLRNIKKWGSSTVVMLTPTDVKDNQIDVDRGDEADIEDIVFKKGKGKKK